MIAHLFLRRIELYCLVSGGVGRHAFDLGLEEDLLAACQVGLYPAVQPGALSPWHTLTAKTEFQLYLAATVANLTLVLQRRIRGTTSDARSFPS